MDAIMSSGVGLYSSLLSGLDIVASTFNTGSGMSYPEGAKYGLVTGLHGAALIFPLCFKVGVIGKLAMYAIADTAGQFSIAEGELTLGSSTFSTNSQSMAITWFG